jgi:hypothetical protein
VTWLTTVSKAKPFASIINLSGKPEYPLFFLLLFLGGVERGVLDSGSKEKNYCWERFWPPKRLIFVYQKISYDERINIKCFFLPWKHLEKHVWAWKDFLFQVLGQLWIERWFLGKKQLCLSGHTSDWILGLSNNTSSFLFQATKVDDISSTLLNWIKYIKGPHEGLFLIGPSAGPTTPGIIFFSKFLFFYINGFSICVI